jgi:hypothetical protein
MKNIGLFTSVYFNNIGNAFIDLGATATIEDALPSEFQIIKLSQYQNFVSTMSTGMFLRESKILRFVWKTLMKNFANILHDKFYSVLPQNKVINMLDFVNLDVLIIPGCVLTVPFYKIYGETLKQASKNGVKIIFLGASGNYYSDYEKEKVTEFLKELKPFALMFRDSVAYETYKHLSVNSYNGIDNAFFVNKIKMPTKISKTEYVVINFDEIKNENLGKKISKDFSNIVYTYNKPFPMSVANHKLQKGIFVSDTPMDYLLILANAKEVHSDRVHSCVPTLSFGGKCKIYSSSPRLSLFENVGLFNIKNELTSISNLNEYQDKQISYLNQLLLKL